MKTNIVWIYHVIAGIIEYFFTIVIPEYIDRIPDRIVDFKRKLKKMRNKTQKEFNSLIKLSFKVNIPLGFIGKFIRKLKGNEIFNKKNNV